MITAEVGSLEGFKMTASCGECPPCCVVGVLPGKEVGNTETG